MLDRPAFTSQDYPCLDMTVMSSLPLSSQSSHDDREQLYNDINLALSTLLDISLLAAQTCVCPICLHTPYSIFLYCGQCFITLHSTANLRDLEAVRT